MNVGLYCLLSFIVFILGICILSLIFNHSMKEGVKEGVEFLNICPFGHKECNLFDKKFNREECNSCLIQAEISTNNRKKALECLEKNL